MQTKTLGEAAFRVLLKNDRGAAIREYRNAMHLHGDPSQSENASDEEMIHSIVGSQQAVTTAR